MRRTSGGPGPGEGEPSGPSRPSRPSRTFLGGVGSIQAEEWAEREGLRGKKENHYSFRLSAFNFS